MTPLPDTPSLNATIVERVDIHEALWIIRVVPNDGEVPSFIAGQYAELGLFIAQQSSSDAVDEIKLKLIRRQYSIASSPSQRNYLEFFIALVDFGELTPSLVKLSKGDQLWLGPKIKGKFTLDEVPHEKDLIMVSTGTGVAPFIAMLEEFAGTNRWRRCVVVNGVRYARDLAYTDELTQIMKRDTSVFYLPTVTREPDNSTWSGHRGRVQALFQNGVLEQQLGLSLVPNETQVLLCGNADMIDGMQALLESRGFALHKKKAPGNIHFERYW